MLPSTTQKRAAKTPSASSTQRDKTTTWRKSEKISKQLPHESPDALANTHPELICMSPMEVFEQIFDDDVFTELQKQFELYAKRDKNNPNFSTTAAEIRQFIGILLLSGYNCLPNERDYWSTADDLGCSIVMKTMPRNRFLELKRYCHIADNNNLSHSKVAKVKPLYDRLNMSLLQFGMFHAKLSIDESMVPYYGHHGAKMFIRGKPIRFGYKIWMLCSSDGYPYQASIYCGKSERPENTGLGEHFVMTFADIIPHKSHHELYFNNFFTSYGLLCLLSDVGLRATGTVRDGRLGGAPLPDKRKFGKADRGKYEFVSDGNICVVRWSDNNVVTCASNFDAVHPVSMVERHIKGSREKQRVSQPRMVARYITGMGGVDLLDRLLGAYRPRIKAKKWWWNLFINAVNIAVVAAWKLHCKAASASHSVTHLQFRRDVVAGLLKGVSRKRLGGPTAAVPTCVRYDGFEHYLDSTTQGRCAECGKNTMKQCTKCEKRLHEKCFQLYHFRV